jgi:hypothetical protein
MLAPAGWQLYESVLLIRGGEGRARVVAAHIRRRWTRPGRPPLPVDDPQWTEQGWVFGLAWALCGLAGAVLLVRGVMGG